MRKENDKPEEPKQYLYRKCQKCDIKLHYEAYTCPKCGERINSQFYYSNDPSDEKYNREINNQKCMSCWLANNGQELCKPIFCFATGRGSCEICRATEGTRFECCQEILKKDGAAPRKTFEEILRGMKKAPVEHADDIPF